MKPISNIEIENASEIIFSDKNKFYDDTINKTGERIKIIQCLESKNIIASPGSGKTTTLLAKLIILGNRMPFDDDRGICVLTHTNVAIDLIKEKLGVKAYQLFSYPNFFGTIQSFVDKFLASTAAIYYYGKRPDRIDSDIADAMLIKSFYNRDKFKCKLQKSIFGQQFVSKSRISKKKFGKVLNLDKPKSIELLDNLAGLQVLDKNNNTYSLNIIKTGWNSLNCLVKERNIKSYIYNLRKEIITQIDEETPMLLKDLVLDYNRQKIIYGTETFRNFSSESGKIFVELKENTFKDGILSYRDAYDIADRYLSDFPSIKDAFSERFKYVFIDEMQDTSFHQSKIIEGLFRENEKVVLQTYGDPNQAIFDNITQEGSWKFEKKDCLYITKSKRFGTNIAKIINPLRVMSDDNFPVVGNSQNQNLPPYLILFKDKDEIINVIKKFGDIILEKNILSEQSKFLAIGRVGTEREEITIKSYYPEYERTSRKNKEYYENLISYLRCNKQLTNTGIRYYSNRIINAFLYLLNKHGIKNEYQKTNKDGVIQKVSYRYSKTSLLSFLKAKHEEQYFELKQNLATWTNKISNNNKLYSIDVKNEIETYVKTVLFPIWNKNIPDDDVFFNIPEEIRTLLYKPEEIENTKYKFENIYLYKYKNLSDEEKEFPIYVNTIHGEKGETHTATLYMETYFKKYESEQLIEQLKGNPYNKDSPELEKALKLAYVGMSRSNHLLCVALQKDKVQDHEKELIKFGWKIIQTE